MNIARRVLASMLNGAKPEDIHARRPDWSMLALRVASAELERVCADLACDIGRAQLKLVSNRYLSR